MFELRFRINISVGRTLVGKTVKFNAAKLESLLIYRKANKSYHPPLLTNNEPIKEVTSHKHVSIFLSSEHINHITAKAWIKINVMRKLKFLLDRRSLEIIYISFIRPLLECADVVCAYRDRSD